MNLNQFVMKNSRWLRLVFAIMPRWMLRYTFIATLASATRAVNLKDDQVRHSLNNVMRLANDDTTTVLAAVADDYIVSTIWSCDIGLEPESTELCPIDLRQQVTQLVQRTPEWARYGSDDVMVTDAMKLFEFSTSHAPLTARG